LFLQHAPQTVRDHDGQYHCRDHKLICKDRSRILDQKFKSKGRERKGDLLIREVATYEGEYQRGFWYQAWASIQ
jgi:hypothetical protein